MIVIVIIGILNTISISNFVAYRQQSICTTVEEDAYNLYLAIHNYFSSPIHTALTGLTPAQIGFDSFSSLGAHKNTGTITGTLDNIIVQVTDTSGKCLGNRPGWLGNVYTKNMK
jgi:type II secretory pathway pseudopilin PulG